MDQLTAYRILRLNPGCSMEEIRAAYAALSKEFHPEEQPEEFQKIHEAYRLLIRQNRNRRDSDRASHSCEEPVSYRNPENAQTEEEPVNPYSYGFDDLLHRKEEELQKEEAQERYDFDTVLRQIEEQERKQREEYDFNRALQQTEQQERERLHRLAQRAALEIETLFTSPNKKNPGGLRRIFEREEYQEILRNPEFLSRFVVLLDRTKLKKGFYDYIIDFYRLRGMNPETLFPEMAQLYRVLDRKHGISEKQNKKYAGVLIAVLIALKFIFKYGSRAARHSEKKGAFASVCVIAVLIYFFIWLHQKLKKKHSEIFAQFIVALLLLVSQFIMLLAEAYAPLIGVEGSDVLCVLIFLGGILWIVVLAVIALIRRIGNRFGSDSRR